MRFFTPQLTIIHQQHRSHQWLRYTSVKYSLADNMRQGKKSHRAVTKWCTGSEWPVNCITVISARWRSHMPFQRRRKWHIPMASYGKKSRGRGGVSISPRGSLMVSNIRPTNWTEDSEKFRCSRKLVPSLPHVRFLGHRLLTSKSPSLIDERF